MSAGRWLTQQSWGLGNDTLAGSNRGTRLGGTPTPRQPDPRTLRTPDNQTCSPQTPRLPDTETTRHPRETRAGLAEALESDIRELAVLYLEVLNGDGHANHLFGHLQPRLREGPGLRPEICQNQIPSASGEWLFKLFQEVGRFVPNLFEGFEAPPEEPGSRCWPTSVSTRASP